MLNIFLLKPAWTISFRKIFFNNTNSENKEEKLNTEAKDGHGKKKKISAHTYTHIQKIGKTGKNQVNILL